MKRTKFLALALVVAVMMMGAGYAAWTDQLFLTSTVRTGNFDMQITQATIRTGDRQDANEAHDWHDYDWTHNGTVSYDANSAIVEFKDMYPGGMVQVDMTTKNMGTIPAKLKSVDVEFLSGNEELFNLLRAETSWKADINGDGEKDAWDHVEWGTWKKLEIALEKQLVNSINENNLVIEPKGWFSLGDDTENGCIKIKLDPKANNDFQKQSCRFKITFNWEQWATDPNANPYNAADDGSLPGYGGDGDLQ